MKKNKKNLKIRIPLTKLQINHRYLIIVAALLFVLLIILLIPKKDEKIEPKEESKNEIKEEIKKENISIYDINSKKRPYAVMIPNDSGAQKRQYGIQNAYITYEITVEGGITRLLSLFKDVNVEKIGPVRSSRHYYLDYALENDAIYVHFGWSPQAQNDISELKINNLNGLYNPSNMFWRDKNYSSPNNAFTSTDKIKKAAENKKYRTESDDYELFTYKKEVDLSKDSTVKDANTIKVNYSGNAYVKYVYDANEKNYLRFNKEKAHIDNLINKQVKVKNILVLKMDTVNISGDDKGRQNLNNTGTGEGYYITDGKIININWYKEKRNSKTVYKNVNGEELNINDGNTFIQIQPTNKKIEVE